MAATKELIKAATIARVSDKAGKFLGFGVKSNHSDEYYQIRCVKGLNGTAYTCNCEAKMWGKECVHIKACKELVEARRQNELAVAAQVAPLIVGEQFASEMSTHIEDELASQDNESEGELAVQAWVILEAEAEQARKELAKATDPAAEQSKKFHAGMFLNRGVSTYVSNAEMAELKARVKAREEARKCSLNAQAEPKLEQAPSGRLVLMR